MLDGELQTAQADLVREHLETCPACSAKRDQLALLSRSIRSLPRDRMPDDLKAAILSAGVRDSQVARRPFLTRPWALASLASAAIVLVVAVATMQRQGAVPPTQPVLGQIARDAHADA
ncbi:MAG TPA: anti-sigma factor, partial [Ktedonobacterales bacterium]|nr:anti-sigma factor [Ktedonobacterales bacterium]